MRCIEILEWDTFDYLADTINKNMRCIEITENGGKIMANY